MPVDDSGKLYGAESLDYTPIPTSLENTLLCYLGGAITSPLHGFIPRQCPAVSGVLFREYDTPTPLQPEIMPFDSKTGGSGGVSRICSPGNLEIALHFPATA